MKAQTLKRIGTTLIVIGLVGAYCTIATMNNRGGVMTLDFVRKVVHGDGNWNTFKRKGRVYNIQRT